MIADIEMAPEAVLELPDCAPTKVLPQDLSKAIKGIEVQKHYASDLFDIKEHEVIPYELFQQVNNSHSPNDPEFVNKVIGLLTENDACDKVGIKFLAKVYNITCSDESNQLGKNICNEIKQSKTAVAKFAILYNNEMKGKL